MKAIISLSISSAAALAATSLSSCTYDPSYYGSPSSYYSPPPNTSVSSAIGYSSNGGISTSLFISTGDSRWGYDPACYSYYDYTTRCYYDPYLNGYYPFGYRPPIIIGAPHPYGWRPGMKTCSPPQHYRNYKLKNYDQRHVSYHNLSQPWAKNIRPGSSHDNGYRGNHSSSNHGTSGSSNYDRGTSYRGTSSSSNYDRGTSSRGTSGSSNYDRGTSYRGTSGSSNYDRGTSSRGTSGSSNYDRGTSYRGTNGSSNYDRGGSSRGTSGSSNYDRGGSSRGTSGSSHGSSSGSSSRPTRDTQRPVVSNPPPVVRTSNPDSSNSRSLFTNRFQPSDKQRESSGRGSETRNRTR